MEQIPINGLIDAHAHLNDLEGIDEVLRQARAAGVHHVVAVGMDHASNEQTLALAQLFPGQVWPAVGYHPWSLQAEQVPGTLEQIRTHLDRCVALGEVGLDYKVKVPKPLQHDVFASLLDIAVQQDRPVIIHCRFSHSRTYAMVRAAGVRQAVFHWYSGPLDILDAILSDGYHISVTPALAYSPPHRKAAERAPIEQVLVETDTPVSYRGRVSQPAHLLKTIEWLGRIKKIPDHEAARITAGNARRFYGIP
jgi:TatD DNase family protein